MAYVLLSPLLWTVLLAIVAIARWRRMARVARVAAAVIGALLLSLWTPLGANTLQRGLESLVPVAARCTPADRGPIVLLSGGFERDPRTADDYGAFTLDTWNRVRMTSELWRVQRSAPLWIVGGGVDAIRESDMAADLAADFQVPRDALHVERASTTTWDGARAVADALAGTRARLVTSPSHRARALFAFEAAGIQACVHAELTDVVALRWPGALLPQVSALQKSQNAVYELVGILYYRLRAWRAPAAAVDARRDAHAARSTSQDRSAGTAGRGGSAA